MGGKHLTTACTLASNGYSVTSHALIDSGANGFVFIDTLCAADIAKYLNLKTQRLPYDVSVKGYDGKAGQPITHYIRLHLTIDGRRLYNTPLLILDLGSQDLILGRKWLAHLKILVDCDAHYLRWPPNLGTSHSVVREITVPRRSLLPQRALWSHQEDVDARDRAFEVEDKMLGVSTIAQTSGRTPVTTKPPDPDTDSPTDSGTEQDLDGSTDLTDYESDLPPPAQPKTKEPRFPPTGGLNQELKAAPKRTHSIDTRDSLRKMDNNLRGIEKPLALPYTKKPFQSSPVPYLIDICAINATGFHYNLMRPENELFSTSLYEIDRILGSRQEVEDRDQEEPQVPDAYKEFLDVFSKEASDILPPHRTYDHQIHLGQPNTLGFSPLYKMTTLELEETKRYLLDNLAKGFIEPSQSPFAAPILFVKKADGRLRFCIDFRKLNDLTRKDRYPLPLIDELLARVSRAKVFTKLDIRQAFHRIRMHPDSEELTTFRTRYGTYKCKVLLFGLTNGPATYQRYMNDVLFDYLDDFCTAYLDDILIYSENELDHEAHVKKVL
jgi:predicted aspartyl protease